MCWFDIVRNIWGFLATSNASITANDNLSNKQFSGLLVNLADIIRTVGAISIIFSVLIPLLPRKMATHWARWIIVQQNKNLVNFDVIWTPYESVRSITSETDVTSLVGIYCTCGMYRNNMSVLLVFYGSMLGSRLGVLLGYSSRSGVNQVYLRSIVSGAPLCELRFTISFQFGGIVTSLINGNVENSSWNTTWNLSETWTVSGFRTRATDTAWNGEIPI